MRRSTQTKLSKQSSRSSLNVGGEDTAAPDELDIYNDHTQKPKFEGILKKKSPKVSFGRHVWQQRYFILLADVLVYKKEKDSKRNSGAICLEAVREVKLIVNKKGRFDILVDSFDANQVRTFALQAEPKLLQTWVNEITTWVNIAHKKESSMMLSRENSVLNNAAISYLFCLNYRLDPKAKKTGICVCGAPKWSHKKPPPPPPAPSSSSSSSSGSLLHRQPSTNHGITKIPCENFHLDLEARVIGNCRCGFLKSAHKPPPAPPSLPLTPSRGISFSGGSPTHKACLKYRENVTAKNPGECLCGLPKNVHLFRPLSLSQQKISDTQTTTKIVNEKEKENSNNSSHRGREGVEGGTGGEEGDKGFWTDALVAVRTQVKIMQETKAKEEAEVQEEEKQKKEAEEQKAKKQKQQEEEEQTLRMRTAEEEEAKKKQQQQPAWEPAWVFDARTVPNDWQEINNMGKIYYYNRVTNETSWEKAPSLRAYEEKWAEWEKELEKDPNWLSKPDLTTPGKILYVEKRSNSVHDEPPAHWLTVQQRETKAAEMWRPSWILSFPESAWMEVNHKFFKGVIYYYNMETKTAQFRKPVEVLEKEKKVVEWEKELAKDPIWLKTKDAEGKISYYNRLSQENVLTKPEHWKSEEELYPEKLKARKEKEDRVIPTLPLESWEPSWLYSAAEYAHDWKEGVHNGGLYYYNKTTGESSWQKPEAIEQQEARWAEWKAELAKDPDWVEVTSRFGNVTYEHRKKKHVMSEKPKHWWTFDQREAERLEKEKIKATQDAEHKAMIEARIKPLVRAIHAALMQNIPPSTTTTTTNANTVNTVNIKQPAGGLPLFMLAALTPTQVANFYKNPNNNDASGNNNHIYNYDMSAYDKRRVPLPKIEDSHDSENSHDTTATATNVATVNTSYAHNVMLSLLLSSPSWSKDGKAWSLTLCHTVTLFVVDEFFLFDNFSVMPTNINVASFSTSEYYVAIEAAGMWGWDQRRVSLERTLQQSKLTYERLEAADDKVEPRWSEEQWTKWWKIKYDLKAKEYLKLMIRLGFADDYAHEEEED